MTKHWKNSDYIKLRRMYKQGIKLKDIAKELGTTDKTVGAYICNERTLGRIKIRRRK